MRRPPGSSVVDWSWYALVTRVNLLTPAGANGQTNFIDPPVGALLSSIAATTSKGPVAASSDPNLDRFSFIDKGVQIRKFVTRSGTNQYHGSLYEYHRNPALNANYWFNNRDPGLLPNEFACLCRYEP